MAGFQKFVTYINLYEKNNKIRNVGFAKIEQQGEQCKIEIHMKGTGYSGISCPVYLFVRSQDNLLGITVGNISMKNGIGDGAFLLNAENINESGFGIKEITGFLIFATEKIMFASQWAEGELLREQFVTLEEARLIPKQEEHTEYEYEEPAELLEPQVVEEEDAIEATKTAIQNLPLQESRETWEEKWQFMLEQYPVLTPFEGEEDILCIRLDVKELRLLPKRYWYLGNNSFLLHGYFNYRYLILGAMQYEQEIHWFLGVPGVYQSQEKVMASIFGFPEYKCEKIAKQKTGQFGYWYRFL